MSHTRTPRRLALTASALGIAVAVPAVALAGPANAASDATWNRIAQCESSGNWASTVGRYDGGLQFLASTWNGFGGRQYAPTADRATRAQQIAVAERVLAVQGWNAWPTCSRRVGVAGQTATPRTVATTTSTSSSRAAASTRANRSTTRAAHPVARAASSPARTSGATYVVRAGDTLSSIAAKLHTTWRALFAHNRATVSNPNLIYPGERLVG